MAALLISMSWDTGDSGTGNLIREFQKKIQRPAERLEVVCTVLDVEVSENQKQDAAKYHVNLIPGTKDVRSKDPSLVWLLYYAHHYQQLEQLEGVQHVISFCSETHAAATVIHEKLFSQAKLHLLTFHDQPPTALFVSNVWNKNDCGLAGFHRNIVQEFCKRKAQAGEAVKAYCTVLEIDALQTTDAESFGVTLIVAQRKEGIEPEDDPPRLHWLLNHESYFSGLREIENVQYVVGYAPMTGFAAANIRRQLFPHAKLVLINHACPENNCLQTRIYGVIEFEEKMLKMASEADLLFSIGPTIHEYFQNAYRADFKGKQLSEIPHEEIFPQITGSFSECAPVQMPTKTNTTHNILTYGQLSTKEALTECTVIGGSISSVAKRGLHNNPPKWKIQGVSQDADSTILTGKMKTKKVQPTLQPGYPADKLLRSLQQSHLCIPAPVYMDYGFNGLEAALLGLPTILLENSELANLINSHFSYYKDSFVVVNPEINLPGKIIQHLQDISLAFKKAKKLKEDYRKSETVSRSYAVFASSLTQQKGQQMLHGTDIPAGARDVTVDTENDDIMQQDDERLSKQQHTHGPEEKDAESAKTITELKMDGTDKNEKSRSMEAVMEPDKDTPDSFPIHVKLDESDLQKRLLQVERETMAISAQLRQMRAKGKRRIEEALADEQDCQEIHTIVKRRVGNVFIRSLSTESLAILPRLPTLYNLYRLKQTCRSGSLAKAFEPLLITDEMKEIALKVGIRLQLKVTYDQEKFTQAELFFINRDGGGIKPLKRYDDDLDEMYIEDYDNECNVEDGHQQEDGYICMTAAEHSDEASKTQLPEPDHHVEIKGRPATEINVCSLLNAEKLTKQGEEKVLTSISWKSMLPRKRDIPQYLDLDVLGEPKPDDKNIVLFKHLLNEIAKYRGKYQKSIKSIKEAQYEAQMLEARLEEMKSAKAAYHYDPTERFDLTMVKFFKQRREQVAELTTENRKLKNILQGLDCEDGKGKTEKSDIEGNEASKEQDEEELIEYLKDLLRPIEDFKKSEDVDNEEASSRALLGAAVLDGNLDIVKQVLSRYEARGYIQEGFILAVMKNQTEIVKYLLGFGISQEDMNAGICVASSFGCITTLMLLLASGGDVNAISDEEKSALHQAIEEKKIDAIRVLVENGADIVSFDQQNGRTPLSIAATVNFVECLEYLLSKGVDVDIRCLSGRTPLHYGAEYDNVETVEYLLSRGADVNAQDSNMKTPLHLAAESDKVEIARQLLRAGADIELKDISGESPIQIAKTKQNSQMSMVLRGEEPEPKVKVQGEEKIPISPEEQKFLKKIKTFKKSGGDVNAEDKDGKIPLHVSTTNNWISAVLFLLDEGAKIGRLDKTGVTPFHVAAVMNHVKILQIFLDKGGDVNKVDEYGCTPLHFAAIGQDCLESVRLLLSAGADPNMRNKNGKTPMDLAVDGKRKEVVSLLKERGTERE